MKNVKKNQLVQCIVISECELEHALKTESNDTCCYAITDDQRVEFRLTETNETIYDSEAYTMLANYFDCSEVTNVIVDCNNDFYITYCKSFGDQKIEDIMHAVNDAIARYPADNVDVVKNELTGMMEVMFHSSKNSFLIHGNICRMIDLSKNNLNKLIKELDNVHVGHCW